LSLRAEPVADHELGNPRVKSRQSLDKYETALRRGPTPHKRESRRQPKPHPGFAVANACDATALAVYREITRGVDEMLPELAKLLR
jgi:hypothetical protein